MEAPKAMRCLGGSHQRLVVVAVERVEDVAEIGAHEGPPEANVPT